MRSVSGLRPDLSAQSVFNHGGVEVVDGTADHAGVELLDLHVLRVGDDVGRRGEDARAVAQFDSAQPIARTISARPSFEGSLGTADDRAFGRSATEWCLCE